MVPKRNNSMNITQETAAEKNKKWEQLKKKGMEQQQKEVIATICSIMGRANTPPVLEAIGLRPYKKEYDLLFEKLKDYFQEWIKDKQAMDFINDRSKEEKEKWEEEGKKTKEQKKKETEEKLKFVTKTTAELSDILLKYGSALFKAKWKINQSPDQKKSAENEICMQDFYPEFKTFTTFLENERQFEEFRSLDLLVRWIQELNSYLVLAWHIGYGKQGELTKKEAEEDNLGASDFYGKNEEEVLSKKEKKNADLDLALTNTLRYCIVHYNPELENQNFERYYHKCAGMASAWIKKTRTRINDTSTTRSKRITNNALRQLTERQHKIASAVFKALDIFNNIKTAMEDPKADKKYYYRNFSEVCIFLEQQKSESPTVEQIQYLIRQNNKDAYSREVIIEVLEKLAPYICSWASILDVMDKKGDDKQEKDYNNMIQSFILNSQKEENMLSVVVAALTYEHDFEPEEIAKELGITKDSIEKVLCNIRLRAIEMLSQKLNDSEDEEGQNNGRYYFKYHKDYRDFK